MLDHKIEVLAAMEFFGINPNLPVSEEDFLRIRSFVWTKRKNGEKVLKEKAKNLNIIPSIEAQTKGIPQSPPEQVLAWAMEQRTLLIGEFKSQHQVGPYYLDFGFPLVKLVVEVDGQQYHSSPADLERDRRRTAYLNSCGWTVIRFTAKDVYDNSATVADKISRTYSALLKTQGLPEAWERFDRQKGEL